MEAMYRALLLKPGTPVYARASSGGCVGTITRVMPGTGTYRIDNGPSVWHVKVDDYEVRPYPIR